MKFQISESENTVTVSVSLTERIYARDPVESVDTKKVLEFLKKNWLSFQKLTIFEFFWA